jgi:hypothetical protein
LPVLETEDFLVDETAVLALGVEEAALLVVGFTGAEDTEVVVTAELVLLSDETDLVEVGLLTEEVFLVGR